MRARTIDGAARPPRILIAIILLSLPAEDGAPLVRELTALWLQRVDETSPAAANRWLARQALGFAVRVGPSRLVPTAQSIESLFADARMSLRRMRREPSFVLSFVITLALSSGVLAAVYSAASSLLLRPVPGVAQPASLVTLRLVAPHSPPRVSWDISALDLVTLQLRLAKLAELAAFTPVDVDVRANAGDSRRVAAELASANYFSVLRAATYAGRALIPSDDAVDAPGVVVVSYDFARSVSADPSSLIGTDLSVNGTKLRVAGVSAPGFHGSELPGRTMLWLSRGALRVADPAAGADAFSKRSYGVWHGTVGRLQPGVAPEQVQTAANAVVAAVRTEFRQNSYLSKTQEFHVTPGIGLDPGVRVSVRRTLGLLLGAALLLLGLAVANLTNLALTRSLSMRTSLAVRHALGASRARIIRGVLMETLMLGACGGVGAIACAVAWDRWFRSAQLTEAGGSLQGIHVDARVAGLAMLASLVAAALAFLRPATRSAASLRMTPVSGAESRTLRTILVAVQVSFSVILLVGAMLLSATVANLRRVDLGFSSDNLLTFSVAPQPHGYDLAGSERLALEIERRLDSAPGVAAAGVISPTPLRSSYMTGSLQRPDDIGGKERVIGAGYYVTPGFFRTLGVPVLAGDSHWRADSGTVVVTRNMLAQLFPGVSPASAIGMTVIGRHNVAQRIAAVVADVRLADLTADAPPTVFGPMRDGIAGEPFTTFVLADDGPARASAAVRQVMATVAPDVPPYDVRTAREAVDLQFTERRVMAAVATTLSALGIVLAAIGLYGVLANVVAAGQREIAIRAALGATPAATISRVFAYGLVPVVGGALLGSAGAVAVARLLASQLFGLGALDPKTYARGIGVALLFGVAACLLPAYRATRVSIVQMLRTE